ncbi:MAG: hypothetical protein ABEI86_09295, partial [Halobacteriaceae archaeon]
FDAHYRDDDTLRDTQAKTLQTRGLAQCNAYAREYDIPVLITRTAINDFTAPLERVADHHLRCKQTAMGPRFIGDEFETLVYPIEDGDYYQTTFAYWQQVLRSRAGHAGVSPTDTTLQSDPANTQVGTGTLADGTATTLSTNPLLDAWADAGGRGR